MNEEMDVLIQKTILELLKHKEYKDIQMKEIAEKANIGRRTLYRYFAYKDEINAIQLSIISVVFCHREPLFFMPKNFKNITKNS